MRILIASLFILLSFSSPAGAEVESQMVCSIVFYSKVKKIVESKGDFDKYKHCAVSCLLALRCPAKEVMHLGILKEGLDLIGPGNAEMDDLKADFTGVGFVTKKKVKTDEECIQQCHQVYPELSC